MAESVGLGLLLATMLSLLFVYPAIYGVWRKVEHCGRFSFVSAGSTLTLIYIASILFTPLEVLLINDVSQLCHDGGGLWFCDVASWLDGAEASIVYWAGIIVMAAVVPHVLFVKYWAEYESCLAVNKKQQPTADSQAE